MTVNTGKQREKDRDGKFFTGRAFTDFLGRYLRAYSDKAGAALSVVTDEGHPQAGGWTDGEQVTVNAANQTVLSLPRMEQKVLSMVGIVAHECGHINYSDMKKRKVYGQGIRRGILFPRMPEARNRREEKAAGQLRECLEGKDRKQLAVLEDILLYLDNIMEDMYIEARQCARFGGAAQEGIALNSRWNVERAASIQQMEDAGDSGLKIMKNVLLQYLRAGRVNDWEGVGKPYLSTLQACRKLMDGAMVSPDADDRFMAANRLLLPLWPYIRREFKRPDKKEPPCPQDTGGDGPLIWVEGEQKELSEESLKKIREAAGFLSRTGEGGSLAGKPEKEILKGLEELQGYPVGVPAGKWKDAGAGLSSLHDGHEICWNRETPGQHDIEHYKSMQKEMEETARRLARRIDPLFYKKDGGKEKGRIQGKRIDAGSLYRMDRRIFGSRNKPGQGRDTAVAVLLDESGSMDCGGKMEAARQAALLLHLVCRQLAVPVLVAGHSTGFTDGPMETVQLYCYTDFDVADGQECYRLMRARARCNNRDGAALACVGGKLADRPERDKLLFVISDGKPYAQKYRGKAAMEDTGNERRKLVGKGIHVTAAVIGDDREDIGQIYGNGFLNISDLSRLPAALAAIIGKYLERGAL